VGIYGAVAKLYRETKEMEMINKREMSRLSLLGMGLFSWAELALFQQGFLMISHEISW